MSRYATDGVYVIAPDLHFPFQDKRFCSMVLEVLFELKPRGFVQVGDALDFWQLSTYDKDPDRKENVYDDLRAYSMFLDRVGTVMQSGSTVHQLEGNHEHRLIRYINRQAPALSKLVPSVADVLDIKLRNTLGAVEWKWHPYQKWDSCKIGNTVIHHGFYYDQSFALTNLKRYRGVNFIQGHTHRLQYATNGDQFSAGLGHGSRTDMTGHKPAPEESAHALGILTVSKGQGSLEIAQRHGNSLRVWGKTFKG